MRDFGPHRFEHGLGLKAFAHRRGVHPQERAARIALLPRPGRQPLGNAATGVEPARQLLVEAGGQGEGPLSESDGQSIYEGRTRPPHQRAVLLW
jgi:hypothetical protein